MREERKIGVKRAGVFVVIFVRRKLGRIYKIRDDRHVALVLRRDRKTEVPQMQRAHRRNKPDPLPLSAQRVDPRAHFLRIGYEIRLKFLFRAITVFRTLFNFLFRHNPAPCRTASFRRAFVLKRVK